MYHLVCVQPFAQYKKGDRVTDPDLVAALLKNRDKHFVKVTAPGAPAAPAAPAFEAE